MNPENIFWESNVLEVSLTTSTLMTVLVGVWFIAVFVPPLSKLEEQSITSTGWAVCGWGYQAEYMFILKDTIATFPRLSTFTWS